MYREGIGCIGSRRITVAQEDWAKRYGAVLAAMGYTVKSGGADGADLAFMRGAREAGGHVICYLPWRSYNQEKIPEGCEVIVYDPVVHTEWARIAEENHGYFKYAKRGTKALFSRNVPIVMGSSWVVAIPAEDRKGGTEHGIRIAAAEGVSCDLVPYAKLDI